MNHCQRRIFVSAALAVTAVLFGGGCGGGDETVRVLSLEPRHGHLTGEQPVNIGGQNFRTDIGYTVYFGAQAASRVIVQSTENLVAVTPGASEPGPVDVTIRGDDGTAVRIREGYNYENMGGNVVEQLGDQQQNQGGNLAY
jgi:hypothetical protein